MSNNLKTLIEWISFGSTEGLD